MEQLLDLAVALTLPPPGSSPEVIATVELRCNELEYRGDVLTNPLTSRDRENLRWYLEEYPKWPYEQFLERGKKIEASLAELGKKLYRSVFGSAGAMGIVQPWRLQPNVQRQISIVSEIPGALSLPWELLHDEQGFLVLRTRNPVSLIRRLPQRELAAFPMPFEPPLRILLVTARPDNVGFVDPRSIARELLDEVQKQVDAGTIVLEFLRPPTLSALRGRLSDPKRPPIHVLHFDGHGVFDVERDMRTMQPLGIKKQGMLLFEDDDGNVDLVEAERVAQVLQDSGTKLAVLTACQSAVGATDDAFSSVAAQLIGSGVDAVSAMSASVLVVSAARYAEAFYRSLASDLSVPVAQERARQALHDDPRRDVHHRRKDDEGTMVTLRDWWLPHFYQQRSVILQQQRPPRRRKKSSASTSLPRFNKDMPAEPRYGFSGRAYELLLIERFLLRGKLVVIRGFGGLGKTALAREAADWLTRTKLYDGACFVSFEHGGDAATLLNTLGTYLDINDGNFNPNDSKSTLTRLASVLEKKRVILIADNLESILPNGVAPLEAAACRQLWDVLLELAKIGAGVILTSRDSAFGDERLASGSKAGHLTLGGLQPDAAYELASHLLTDLGIDRARASYSEVRDLLAQLDYHPLAIQLVLPSLGELPPAKIRTDFEALLPRFVDDTTTGRNRSLLASLDYSLRRLSKEQQALLPRLAPFEGGAHQDILLAITKIPETAWVSLYAALEQAGLVTAEWVYEDLATPFLHFHPILIPFLRSLPNADDPNLHQDYIDHYYALAVFLHDQDERAPLRTRALVRRELPNLRRVLGLLREEGDIMYATAMTVILAKFLSQFGLWRERDELQRWVTTSMDKIDVQESGVLTPVEYLLESRLGDEEYEKDNLRAAASRFTALLARIEARPEGMPLGQGSFEHAVTLQRLTRCLIWDEPPSTATDRLYKALKIIDALIEQQPEGQNLVVARNKVLSDLGDMLEVQGQYVEARDVYKETLKVALQQGALRSQAVALTELGSLAMKQWEYSDAQAYYTAALKIFHDLNEPQSESVSWTKLGDIAQEQKDWDEAEHCYRESLMLEEQLGNETGIVSTCNQLALLAQLTDRFDEAEGWLKRALMLLDERVHYEDPFYSTILNNLANLLVDEVQSGYALVARLSEAQNYAERALAIDERLGDSSETWTPLFILTSIARLRGRQEEERYYRRREHEAYAAFKGNRSRSDYHYATLINAMVAGTKGNIQAREAVEAFIAELGMGGRNMAATVQRIWAGERDWHLLTEDLSREQALVFLRVLETLAQSPDTRPTETRDNI
jgi:tetratricopeptide (TPR) repeat protein